eukprot:CAMPEP_0113486182 /NCGR_PEP_ID=MMETSP0014_2-20120614/24865_1 /TAXON_ID=2857 /ORGANISM="Nitzschia sp." /LENGTH=643 /DNA_ID=CAMNT_0000379847 /DNA_START=129 /DNA_END=2057 /DNA_ORIENTATION=- /assembly_acc=CAM_ASM_000159
MSTTVENEVDTSSTTTATSGDDPKPSLSNNGNTVDRQYWEIAPTLQNPTPRPLTQKFQHAMETQTHPAENAEQDLGRGIFITDDWRRAWSNYESPSDYKALIDSDTGYAEYDIDEIEGRVPDDIVGTLYRNGPGKFGRGNERVQHVLDADALVYSITFPSTSSESESESSSDSSSSERQFTFRSRFVETKAFKEEKEADKFLYRSTFGTGPTASFFDKDRPKNGLNSDPIEPSTLSKVFGGALNVDVKNPANTQVIAFGGKLLALFEAGLPYQLDPETLETIGEDTMGGALKPGLAVKLGPEDSLLGGAASPSFLGGDAHTAHPNIDSKTGNLVGWSWAQMPLKKSMQITITEWSPDRFEKINSKTFEVPGCELAPHDTALTENYVMLKANALTMNTAPFLLGLKGPAASLAMDGRANVTSWIFPRPTSKTQFEPFPVSVPPCFSIHFSHAYEDEDTGNLVTFFSGWPASDSKDFLGAWGGFAPDFRQIPQTFLWRLEIDVKERKCISLDIAPGTANVCVEHVLVNPAFNVRKAEYVYGIASNLIGDSTAPCGYVRMEVESGSTHMLTEGEFNKDVDAYFFGTRYFATEPIIVPKKDKNGKPYENERACYLLGVVQDMAKNKAFLAIFDCEKDMEEGPVAKLW